MIRDRIWEIASRAGTVLRVGCGSLLVLGYLVLATLSWYEFGKVWYSEYIPSLIRFEVGLVTGHEPLWLRSGVFLYMLVWICFVLAISCLPGIPVFFVLRMLARRISSFVGRVYRRLR